MQEMLDSLAPVLFSLASQQLWYQASFQKPRENIEVLGKTAGCAEWNNSSNDHLNCGTGSWGSVSLLPSDSVQRQTLSKPRFHCSDMSTFSQTGSHWSQCRWLEDSWEGVKIFTERDHSSTGSKLFQLILPTGLRG